MMRKRVRKENTKLKEKKKSTNRNTANLPITG